MNCDHYDSFTAGVTEIFDVSKEEADKVVMFVFENAQQYGEGDLMIMIISFVSDKKWNTDMGLLGSNLVGRVAGMKMNEPEKEEEL